MKPKIWAHGGVWFCGIRKGSWSGLGFSPREAWEAWLVAATHPCDR